MGGGLDCEMGWEWGGQEGSGKRWERERHGRGWRTRGGDVGGEGGGLG